MGQEHLFLHVRPRRGGLPGSLCPTLLCPREEEGALGEELPHKSTRFPVPSFPESFQNQSREGLLKN